jgi:hypothetical protein
MKRYDDETVEKLVRLTQQDELWDSFPFEQGKAAHVLAQIDEVDAVVKAIVRWALQTTSEVTDWRFEHTPFDDDIMSSAFEALEDTGKMAPGVIMAIGVGCRTDKLQLVRNTLPNSAATSDTALACIITLGRLRDDLAESIELIATHLEIHRHRHAACVALLRIGTNRALDKVLDHLKDGYDQWLATELLAYEHSFGSALEEVEKDLANKSRMYKLGVLVHLSKTPRAEKILSSLLGQAELQDAVRAGVTIDENSPSWSVGLKASAIEILGRFDRQAAFEAAWAMLRNANAHDREYYPYIMVATNKQRAVPALLAQLAVEDYVRVMWAIGRSLSTMDISIFVQERLKSPDTLEKLAATRIAGWLKPSDSLQSHLKACLSEVDERVRLAASESLKRISVSCEVEVLLKAIDAEQDLKPKWVLLDCLLAIADPGDNHTNWPCWALGLLKTLASAMRLHLAKTIEKRKAEIAEQGDMKDRRTHQSPR